MNKRIKCLLYCFVVTICFLPGCRSYNDDNSDHSENVSFPITMTDNSAMIEKSGNVFLADVNVSKSSIVISLVNESSDDLIYNHNLIVQEDNNGAHNEIGIDTAYKIINDKYCISSGDKVNILFPNFGIHKEGNYTLSIELFDSAGGAPFYVSKEIELTSDGMTKNNGPVESGRRANRIDYCIIESSELEIQNFDYSKETIEFDFVNGMDREYGYSEGIRIYKKKNDYYEVVRPNKLAAVKDIIEIVEAGKEVRLTFANDYDLGKGEYKLAFTIIDPLNPVCCFLSHDFVITT